MGPMQSAQKFSGFFFVSKNLIIFQVQALFCVGKTFNNNYFLSVFDRPKKLLNKSLI